MNPKEELDELISAIEDKETKDHEQVLRHAAITVHATLDALRAAGEYFRQDSLIQQITLQEMMLKEISQRYSELKG